MDAPSGSNAAAGAPRPRAPSGELFALKISVCAWCGKQAMHGLWDDGDVTLHGFVTGRRQLVSHSICPSCFAEHAPNTPYPTTTTDGISP
jgi:hypothetical protein